MLQFLCKFRQQKDSYNVLHLTVQGLTMEHLQQVSGSIQRALHVRDEQMAWVDACCLQFTVKNKDGREKETFTFQTNNPVIKKDWIVGKKKRFHY